MTALTPQQKERVTAARQRAKRIKRNGYLSTPPGLDAAIARANASEDWRTLGYDSWDAYIEREFVVHFPAEQHGWVRSFLAPSTGKTRRGGDRRDVYFIQAEQGGLIKIGVAGNPRDRLRTLQHTSPVRLRILAVIRAVGQAHETELHQQFAAIRSHGEWFEPTPELLAYIAEHAEVPR
jgi:hypothetical protein